MNDNNNNSEKKSLYFAMFISLLISIFISYHYKINFIALFALFFLFTYLIFLIKQARASSEEEKNAHTITRKIALFHELWNNAKTIEKIRIISALCILLITLFVLFSDKAFLTENSITNDAAIYLDKVQKSAASAFLIARSLNAVISVMQTVTVGGSFGFTGNVSIGEALDPINDLIERFSWAMLAVTVAIGIQKFMMDIGMELNLTWIILPMLLIILARLSSQIYLSLPTNQQDHPKLNKLTSVLSKQEYHNHLIVIPCKVLIIIFLVQFAIPLVGYVNHQISSGHIIEQRNQTMLAINRSQNVLDKTVTGKQLITNFNRVERIVMNESDNIITNTIKLISLFVIETMILPILLIWGLIKIISMLIFTKAKRQYA